MKKILLFNLVLAFMLISFQTAIAHVWEIRVNQNTDGSLTWYVQSYHPAGQCGIANSGIIINGIQYPLEQEFSGSIVGLSPTVFAVNGNYARGSYAVIHTPFLGTTLNVQPYSTNACWYNLVSGSGNFTPPPPPVCTSFPVNGFTNTVSLPGDNATTECDPTDDVLPATITVSHQSCGSITGDGKFSLIVDPNGSAQLYGPYDYSTGITTDVSLNLPYGFSASTPISVVDADFPGFEVTHGLTGIPGGQFTGVPDSSLPVVLTQNFTAALDASGSVVISPTNVDAGSYDACGAVTLSLDKTTFSCSDKGQNTVTLTAVDASGNSSSATAVVTVVDNIAPNVVAQDVTVYLDENGSATITPDMVDNGTTDNCDFTLALTQSTFDCSSVSPDLSSVNIPNTVVRGFAGRTVTFSNISVNGTGDNTVGVAPGSTVTISLNWSSQYTSNYCPGCIQQFYFGIKNLGISCLYSGSTYWSHSGSGSLTITAPSTPGIYPIQANSSLQYSCTATAASLSDNLNGALGYIVVGESSSLIATDSSGNTSTTSFNVTILDNIAPVVVTQDITVALDENGSVSIDPLDVNGASSDNCAIDSYSLDVSSFDCSNIGENEVTLTVTDINGNVSSGTATVTVVDNTAPVVVTQNVTVELDETGNASVTIDDIDNGSSDNCSIAGFVLYNGTFDCSNVGENEVILTVTDESGNSASAPATVTVVDNVAPEAVAQDLTLELDENGVASTSADDVDNGSSDNCGVASISLSQTDFDCSNVGDNVVTLTVTDNNGNTSEATATITVLDNIDPTISVPADISQLNDAGVCGATIDIGMATAADNCSIASIESDAPDFFPVGTTTVTWTATDASGNSVSGEQTVTVLNNAPVLGTIDVSKPVQLGSITYGNATFDDNNLVSATWVWGDGETSNGIIGATTVAGGHEYLATGIYDVSLIIEDACGETDEISFGYTVVFDPCGGHVTGGGWIDSPISAFSWNPANDTKANYGFVAKYAGSSIDPESQLTFHINDENFSVSSTGIDWLMVNSDQAVFSGECTINGAGQYFFIVSVIDGDVIQKHDPDYFRLIVWDATETVIYDNQFGDYDGARASQQISQGSIKIHKGCGEEDEEEEAPVANNGNGKGKGKSLEVDLTDADFGVKLFPNPVRERINLNISNMTEGEVTVEIFDMSGRLFLKNTKVNVAGRNAILDISHVGLIQGNYLLRVINNKTQESRQIQFNKD